MKSTTVFLIWLILFFITLSPDLSVSAAQDAVSSGLDEERLVDRIKQEIMDELENSGFLAEQIEKGIQAFIDKQRQQGASAAADKTKSVRPPTAADHIRGDPRALISVIEYSDFECPFCKKFHPTVIQLLEEYPQTVNWVYRHFPLEFHNPGAQKQAEASECADELGGNDAFWRYADLIYERTRSNGKGFPVARLVPLAVEIGLDRLNFKRCLESGKYSKHVQEDYQEGVRVGISGTPGNILRNNESGDVIPRMGAASIETLRADLERLL